MICEKIKYTQFRNIESSEIIFSPGINVISGENAAGKTNALEGIYIFAQGRSFRAAKDAELIKFEQKEARIELDYSDRFRTHKMSVRYLRDGKKNCKKNGVDIKKMSEFIGNFRSVLFCPLHLSLVKSGPAVRRNFLDVALAQLDHGYTSALSRYNAVLMQRNAFLKSLCVNPNQSKEMLDILSLQLSSEAEFIAAERALYTDQVDKYVRALFADMTSDSERPKVKYLCGKTKEEYYKLLSENIEKEIRYGTTLYGTHRDDILIFMNGKEAKLYASQGQQRSIALAMKLGEGEISKERGGEYPVFLFDDVFSELDERRRRYITGGLSGRQVIITACEKNILDFSGDEVKIITTEKGNYSF